MTVLKWASMLMLFVVSTAMGLLGLTAEMGLAVAAGALGLAFANLDRFKKFSAAGFSAEMVEQVFQKEPEEQEKTNVATAELEAEVARALLSQRYDWRTIKGIAADAGAKEQEIWTCLLDMYRKGLVKSGNKTSGAMVWSATPRLKQAYGIG